VDGAGTGPVERGLGRPERGPGRDDVVDDQHRAADPPPGDEGRARSGAHAGSGRSEAARRPPAGAGRGTAPPAATPRRGPAPRPGRSRGGAAGPVTWAPTSRRPPRAGGPAAPWRRPAIAPPAWRCRTSAPGAAAARPAEGKHRRHGSGRRRRPDRGRAARARRGTVSAAHGALGGQEHAAGLAKGCVRVPERDGVRSAGERGGESSSEGDDPAHDFRTQRRQTFPASIGRAGVDPRQRTGKSAATARAADPVRRLGRRTATATEHVRAKRVGADRSAAVSGDEDSVPIVLGLERTGGSTSRYSACSSTGG
jgi:hypothetical protein